MFFLGFDTPWKFNIAPENGWLEDEFPFGIPYFQGRTVKLRGGNSKGLKNPNISPPSPNIRQANIGVAMGIQGTEVAKGASEPWWYLWWRHLVQGVG